MYSQTSYVITLCSRKNGTQERVDCTILTLIKPFFQCLEHLFFRKSYEHLIEKGRGSVLSVILVDNLVVWTARLQFFECELHFCEVDFAEQVGSG